jgi:hypothetical protein
VTLEDTAVRRFSACFSFSVKKKERYAFRVMITIISSVGLDWKSAISNEEA